ncbi:MAG TPA: hypothetical protein IGS40_19800 [Trichormus sp. M33_DOE_039]|nr:hypothetical protein [Trichormus sp. M33_DOE_039]
MQSLQAKKPTNAPEAGMFQAHSFAMQPKKSEKSQPPDLKTSLIQAERYGHHLNHIQPVGVSDSQAVQPKTTGGSSNFEVVQMANGKRPHSGTVSSASKRPRRNIYSIGQHGYKKNEQKRLSNQYSTIISGNTHQSEHPLGFEKVHNLTSHEPRGQGSRARYLENIAPAYQERYALHRDHIGTNRPSYRPDQFDSGFSPNSYWSTQRSLLESGDVSSAVQINQLAYAFNPAFRQGTNTPATKAATDSYQTMVNNMESVTYAKGKENIKVDVDPWQQQEMLLARRIAQTGKWPTQQEIEQAKMAARNSSL